MKKASPEKARARRTGGAKCEAQKHRAPSAPQSSGKPVKPVVMQDEPYEAKVLGQVRVVKGWTNDGNLKLADGTEFVFEPLVEPSFRFHARALHSVAALELVTEWQIENQIGTAYWWMNGEARLHPDFLGRLVNSNDPDTCRFLNLRDELHALDSEASSTVCAVAWFVSSDDRQGEHEMVLLREFYRVQPASPPREKDERANGSSHEAAIKEIAADVKALAARKAKRDHKTYSRAAKTKAKWFGHEQELSRMARHARKFLKLDAQGKVIRGAWDTAIEQGKGWWKRHNFADPKLSGLLDNQSKQWLRRVILKDWREEKRRLD